MRPTPTLRYAHVLLSVCCIVFSGSQQIMHCTVDNSTAGALVVVGKSHETHLWFHDVKRNLDAEDPPVRRGVANDLSAASQRIDSHHLNHCEDGRLTCYQAGSIHSSVSDSSILWREHIAGQHLKACKRRRMVAARSPMNDITEMIKNAYGQVFKMPFHCPTRFSLHK